MFPASGCPANTWHDQADLLGACLIRLFGLRRVESTCDRLLDMAWQLAAHAAGVAAAQASWLCQPCQPMELSSQLQEQSSQQLSQACQLPQQLVMQFQDDLQLLREQAASSLQIHAQAVDAMLQAVAAAAGAEQHFSTAVAVGFFFSSSPGSSTGIRRGLMGGRCSQGPSQMAAQHSWQ